MVDQWKELVGQRVMVEGGKETVELVRPAQEIDQDIRVLSEIDTGL